MPGPTNDETAERKGPTMTDEIQINEPLLAKTMHHLTAHPEEHEQRLWLARGSCGTAGCLAGWALHFAGHEMIFEDFDHDTSEFLGNPRLPWLRRFDAAVGSMADGRDIAYVARRELGLSRAQADRLFHGDNTLDGMWEMVEDWTEGRVRREESL
jgi:hypothetical protein